MVQMPHSPLYVPGSCPVWVGPSSGKAQAPGPLVSISARTKQQHLVVYILTPITPCHNDHDGVAIPGSQAKGLPVRVPDRHLPADSSVDSRRGIHRARRRLWWSARVVASAAESSSTTAAALPSDSPSAQRPGEVGSSMARRHLEDPAADLSCRRGLVWRPVTGVTGH